MLIYHDCDADFQERINKDLGLVELERSHLVDSLTLMER